MKINPDGWSVAGCNIIYAPRGQAGEYAKLATNPILGQLRSKSSTRREGVTVCDDAGFGDCGYANHWAVELSSHVSGQGIYLTVGQRFAQIIYQRTETPPIQAYSGQYNAADWPSCMLPKKHKGKELPWAMLEKHSPFLGLLSWVKSKPSPAKTGNSLPKYTITVVEA